MPSAVAPSRPIWRWPPREADRAPAAADAVDAEDVERIVVAHRGLQEGYGGIADARGPEADQHRAAGSHESAGRRDGDEACHGAGRCAEHGRVAAVGPFDSDPGHYRHGRGRVGGEEGKARGAIGRQRAAGVEAEPADPQHGGADDGERKAVRRHGLAAESLAFAEEDGRDERGEAARHVHDQATGEVEGAEVDADPAAAPDHVGEGNVDHQEPDGSERQIGAEAHALGEGAEHQRGGDDGEHALEHDEHVGGDRSGERGRSDPGEEHHAGVADETVAFAERQTVARDHPQNADEARGDETLHQDREDVLAANQPSVEEREPGQRHHEHQRRARQHPGGVTGVQRVHFLHHHFHLLGDGGARDQQRSRPGGHSQRVANSGTHVGLPLQ